MAIFAFIKRLIFYLGVLIIITSFFIPIISFDGNSFALIDNNPYIPTVVIILCVAELILLRLKKPKLVIIPLIVNIVLIFLAIKDIFSIDGLDLVEYKKEIAVFLFPIGVILCIIAEVLIIFTNNEFLEKRKEKKKVEKSIDKALDSLGEFVSKESNEEIKKPKLKSIFDYSEPKIPIDALKLSDIPSESVPQIEVENEIIDNLDFNKISETLLFDNEVKFDLFNSSINSYSDVNYDFESNVINENSYDIPYDNLVDMNFSEVVNNQTNDNYLNNNETYNFNGISVRDNEVVESLDDFDDGMQDVIENVQEIPFKSYNNNLSDVPEISNENVMINNIQEADIPKQTYMAINPNDRIVDMEIKKEDVPQINITDRKIDNSLGRTCNFCGTPLGNNERICPLCGRIN